MYCAYLVCTDTKPVKAQILKIATQVLQYWYSALCIATPVLLISAYLGLGIHRIGSTFGVMPFKAKILRMAIYILRVLCLTVLAMPKSSLWYQFTTDTMPVKA
jgi:hypothetical protein